MRPKKIVPTNELDMYRSHLKQMINLRHELVQLAGKLDWEWIDGQIAVRRAGPAGSGDPVHGRAAVAEAHLRPIRRRGLRALGRQPVLPVLHRRGVLPARVPARPLGAQPLAQEVGRQARLLAETLRVAHFSGALRIGDLARVTVDTTVQPKNITFPTDAKLVHSAIKGLNRMADRHGVPLRQSYLRLAKRAALMAGRYAHAKQFNRYRRELRFLRTRLGRLIHDVGRKVIGTDLEMVFHDTLQRARQIRSQEQRQRGYKVYSFHAPEVECIGKGKARAPYEFGVKASIVTTNRRAPGGQFMLHARSLPGNPYDGHTLAAVIDDTEALTGRSIERVYVDKGYRGHSTTNPRRVFLSGQKRGVGGIIKRELRRRSAIEAVIGHLKNDGHLGRCFLKGRHGDAANVVLSAVGYNLRLILRWFRALLCLFAAAIGFVSATIAVA